MRILISMICVLSMGVINVRAQSEVSEVPTLPGWKNLPGDEFNGTSVNKRYGDYMVTLNETMPMMPMVITLDRVWHRLIVSKWLR